MTCFNISLLPALTLFLTFSLVIAQIIPPVLHGQQIIDLFIDDFVDFPNLAEQWNPVGLLSTTKTVEDGGVYNFGGLNIIGPGTYVERTYTSLPSHITIYYIIRITVFGTWTNSDMFAIYFDDTLASSWNSLPITTLPPDVDEIPLGVPQIFDIVGSKSHNSGNLKLKIESGFVTASNTASFGISKIQFLLSTASNIDPKGTCTKHNNYALSCDDCAAKWYDAGSSGCFTCNINCQECFGGLANQCYACQDGSYFDGVQCTPCHPNCLHCTGPNENQCTICNSGDILNWDNTCSGSCLYSLVGSGSYKICQTPCQPTNNYLLWDGTCSDTCDAPLKAEIQGSAKFCQFGCDNTNNEYLYWNGTCSQTCTNYPRDDSGYKFCESCQPGYFMYKDGVCRSSCPSGYQRAIGQSNFCDFPCYGDKPYMYMLDSSCKATCEYPYQVQSDFFCIISLSQGEVEQAKTISGALGGSGKAASAVANVGGLFSSGNPAAIFLMTLTEMLQYIKFMKIKYPPKLQQILDLDEGNALEMFPDLPDKTVSAFGQYTLPGKFEQYQLESSFFVNFWQQMLTLSTLILIIMLISIALKYTDRFPRIQKILEKIKLSLKWNFTLMMLTSYYGNIVFYSSFEFRTTHINNFLSALSLFTTIGFNLLAIFIFAKMINIIRDIRKPLVPTKRLGRIRKISSKTHRWKEYQVIFEACKNGSFLQQAFMPIFVGRLVLFNLVIAYLFDYPLAQAILITLMSALMFLFLAIKRPFKDKIDLIEYLVQEIVILIVNSCTLILGILDAAGAEALDARYNLGEVIIGANIAFSSIALFYMILQMIITLKNLYHVLMDSYRKRKLRKESEMKGKREADVTFDKPMETSAQYLNPGKNGAWKSKHKGSLENSVFPETSSSQIFASQLHSNYEYNFETPNISVHPPSPKVEGNTILDQSINLNSVNPVQNDSIIENSIERPKPLNIFRRRSKKTSALI